MNLSIKIGENPETWDKFIKSTSQGSVFLFYNFLQALDSNFQLITCYDEKDIVAGCAIIFDENNQPIKSNFPFTMYQGIVLADFSCEKPHTRYNYELKILTFFIEKLHEIFEHFFLCQSWQMRDLRAFQWHNYHTPEKGVFQIDLRYTGILDLNLIDRENYISKQIRTSKKSDYQKALKNNYQIVESNNIIELLSLYSKTFERQGLKVKDREIKLITNITSTAIKNNFGKLFFAQNPSGEYTNATLFLYDNFCAYYLIAANSPEHRNSGASVFLMLHNIFYAQDLGKNYVDFVGINSPQRGDFKLAFNAEPKPYFHLKT